jgi:hypothetical protein
MHIEREGNAQRRTLVFPDGVTELLMVSPIDSDHFRLEESAISSIFFTLDFGEAYYHDVIRASVRGDGALEFHGITERSGLLTQCRILSKDIIESPGLRLILDYLMSIGGNWERAFGGLLLVHVPPDFADTIDERIIALDANRKV